jgi:hypothetical protein
MMIMGTAQIPESEGADVVVLVMAITMTTAWVRRTCRAVAKALGKRRKPTMGRGQGRERGEEV